MLRSRDAAMLEDIDGGAVKALDFGGRVTVASTKNFQLQVLPCQWSAVSACATPVLQP